MAKEDCLKVHTCECGKKFIPTPQWLYKLRSKKKQEKIAYYCSYTCWRKNGGDNGKRYRTVKSTK